MVTSERGKLFKLGTSLSQELLFQIVGVIARHLDVFVWTSTNMPGIDPNFLCHRVTMDNRARPVVQRRRNLIRKDIWSLKRKHRSCWKPVILGRSSTPNGWRMWCWFGKPTTGGGCAQTSQTLTRLVQRIHTHCWALILWWTTPQDAE